MRPTYQIPCLCQRYPEKAKELGFIRSGRCYYCGNKKVVERYYELPDSADMAWTEVPFEKVETEWTDISISIICPCGESVGFNDVYEENICSCGRVYRFSTSIKWDETYAGRLDELKKLCGEKHE